MAELEIEVRPRTELGSAAARRLRRQGWVPASLYGSIGSIPVQVNQKELERLLRQEGARTRVLRLRLVDGGAGGQEGSYPVLIKEVQVHPVTDQWLHVDFYAVPQDRPVRARVPVLVEGLEQLTARGLVAAVLQREVEVECLPSLLPAYVAVDVSRLNAGQHVAAGELKLPEGVHVRSEPEEILVSAVAPRGAAAEEAEAAAAAAAQAPAEPERVTRRRAREEEEEEK
ncbi:MAG TPA: 50S ribosomal protein L25 [Limnochordales bacterium]